MALPEVLREESWSHSTAKVIIPILVWCAENGTKITYGGLNQELVDRGLGHSVHAAAYGKPAGLVGDALFETAEEWLQKIPPLNALIVSKNSGMPGSGVAAYLLKYKNPNSRRRKLSDEDRFAVAEDVISDVHGYLRWRELLKHYGMRPIEGVVQNAEASTEETSIRLPKRSQIGGGGVESQEHKELKEFVRDNPRLLKEFGRFVKGENEFVLQSGDKLDVHFQNDSLRLGVEVKASNAGENEITRGIFQCVKYRAVLRAEQKAENELPNAITVLATPVKLTNDQKKLAKRFNIPVMSAF